MTIIKHPGKTKRDHSRGLIAKNIANKQARAAWQHDSKATQANFPFLTCNGKRNRSKNNKGVYYSAIKTEMR